jgi:hypothetical protein
MIVSADFYIIFKDNSMNTEQPMEDRLWDYIDGLSSPAERSAIETLIAANQEWRRKYRELLDVHQLLAGAELEEPSLRFTKNVMEEIARHHVAPATTTYVNKNIIRSIGAFFLSMIAGLLIYCFAAIKWSSVSSSSSSNLISSYSTSLEKNSPLEKINWGKLFSSSYVTAFMLIAVVSGLVLLDLYLQRKKQQVS